MNIPLRVFNDFFLNWTCVNKNALFKQHLASHYCILYYTTHIILLYVLTLNFYWKCVSCLFAVSAITGLKRCKKNERLRTTFQQHFEQLLIMLTSIVIGYLLCNWTIRTQHCSMWPNSFTLYIDLFKEKY